MTPASTCRSLLILVALLAVTGVTGGQSGRAPSNEIAPSDEIKFEQVEATVRRYFQAQPDFDSYQILSRSQASELFSFLDKRGWKTSHRRRIENRLLPDNHFVVRQLRTPHGDAFMKAIARYPGGYDRLDRLSSISGGRKIVSELVRGTGGHQLIEYMTTSKGGRGLSNQLSNVKGGKDFEKPTRRIYTLDELVAALREAHQLESTRRPASRQAP